MGPTENMKLVQLKSGGEEYNHVEALFKQGGAGVPIKTVLTYYNILNIVCTLQPPHLLRPMHFQKALFSLI